MSIATEIQRLAQAKADIKSAIEEKGVEVGNGTLDTYAAKIAEITGGGGGVPAGYKTVTFMNGDNVLFERFVLNGDDCPDPVTQGRIETPTKESTPQYNYTHSGWTSADGGTANSSILKNITEDKVVYSAYTESVRYYTVNFYDEDGTTVLNTEQVTYGGSSTYTPDKKENYLFTGWVPEPTNITGDLTCIAAWKESYSFADASWEYIAQISESGKAADAFSVGDTRTTTINGKTAVIEILGFNHDNLADGSGKAGITVWVKNVSALTNAVKINSSAEYTSQEFYTAALSLFDTFETKLQPIIKEVTKGLDRGSPVNVKVWALSPIELGFNQYGASSDTMYEKFTITPKSDQNGNYSDIALGYMYWTRYCGPYANIRVITAAGGMVQAYPYSAAYPQIAFCI